MINLDLSDKRPLYEQIRDRFKELIEHGVLLPDSQMPSVRSMAVELSINPNTIQRAYTELDREGFTYSVKGRGSFVSDISELLPKRQEEFYTELDALLAKTERVKLKSEAVMTHVKEFYDKNTEGECEL